MAHPTGSAVIEVRLRELSQLFESLDPSPFAEKDLDPKAELYIIESFKELSPRTAHELVLHLDRAPTDTEASVEQAVHDYFARQAHQLRRDLRALLRRGLTSLAIGLGFLAAVFIIEQRVVHWLGNSPVAPLFTQGLLIVGWVAMWRPLEIFLYDWWPIVGRRRLHEQLSRTPVRLVVSPARTEGTA